MFGRFRKTVLAPPPSSAPLPPLLVPEGSPPKGVVSGVTPPPPLVVRIEIDWAEPTDAMIDGAVAAMVTHEGFLSELFDQSELRDIARVVLAGAVEAARG
ncbi:MAG: hypothetical protein DI568_16660 [Sphingomonas sp.]|nr:MAG: hypothetical protein DI568_16660 [Sphingomonas sp.]